MPGCFSSIRFGPAPLRRTLTKSEGGFFARTSCIPLSTVVRDRPAARATNSLPPRPNAKASTPAQSLVVRSSRNRLISLNRFATSFLVAIATFDHARACLSIFLPTGRVIRSQALTAFAGGRDTAARANAGMWGSGGPAVDANGRVYMTTGNSPRGPIDAYWGESILVWGPDPVLNLVGTYSPLSRLWWGHC